MSFLKGRDDMNFTFGIATSGGNRAKLRIKEIINSIDRQSVKIPKCQVVIIGDAGLYEKKDLDMMNTDPNRSVDYIPFDKTVKKFRMVKKKNLIAEYATHENIVYMNDHLFLDDDWHAHFIAFENDWDLCMNAIINTNRKRYRRSATKGKKGEGQTKDRG